MKKVLERMQVEKDVMVSIPPPFLSPSLPPSLICPDHFPLFPIHFVHPFPISFLAILYNTYPLILLFSPPPSLPPSFPPFRARAESASSKTRKTASRPFTSGRGNGESRGREGGREGRKEGRM